MLVVEYVYVLSASTLHWRVVGIVVMRFDNILNFCDCQCVGSVYMIVLLFSLYILLSSVHPLKSDVNFSEARSAIHCNNFWQQDGNFPFNQKGHLRVSLCNNLICYHRSSWMKLYHTFMIVIVIQCMEQSRMGFPNPYSVTWLGSSIISVILVLPYVKNIILVRQ
jgi:hypothetical protein